MIEFLFGLAFGFMLGVSIEREKPAALIPTNPQNVCETCGEYPCVKQSNRYSSVIRPCVPPIDLSNPPSGGSAATRNVS